MTRTVQCPECGVVLNVPSTRGRAQAEVPEVCHEVHGAVSRRPGRIRPSPSPALSSTMFPTRKAPAQQRRLRHAPDMRKEQRLDRAAVLGPEGGREQRRLRPAVLRLDDGRHVRPAPADGRRPQARQGPEPEPRPDQAPAPAADVLALFQDEPKTNRKPKGAEARAKARRCPDCGGVVGVGMSLCNTCGLDLDTGQRTVAPGRLRGRDARGPQGRGPRPWASSSSAALRRDGELPARRSPRWWPRGRRAGRGCFLPDGGLGCSASTRRSSSSDASQSAR